MHGGASRLVLLDLSLPKLDGMEVLAELRARHNDASVLVLTGRCERNVIEQCLDMGADDCLLKPLALELAARCRALIRRRGQVANAVLRHGDLELHRIEHSVTRGGRSIDLTVKEFALLEALMLHRGECVARSQLLSEVWQMPPQAVTNVVDVYITYLRRKLEVDPAPNHNSGLIETVRGTGYKLNGLGSQPIMRKPVAHELELHAVSDAACASRHSDAVVHNHAA